MLSSAHEQLNKLPRLLSCKAIAIACKAIATCSHEPLSAVANVARELVLSRRGFLGLSPHSIAFVPERGRNSERIDFAGLPPPPLIPRRVILTVVDGAQSYGEFIAHFKR